MELFIHICVYMGVKVNRRDELRELYVAYYPRLVAELALVAGSRAAGEDCASEAFTRLVGHWNRVSLYDQPRAWVRKVGYNLAIDEKRRHGRTSPMESVDPAVPAHDVELLDIWRAIKHLPPQQREVLIRHVADGLSDVELAQELHIPTGTVKSRLSRARTALRSQIGDRQ